MLKEAVGDHRHEGVTVKSVPGSSFEVIEPKFFFELLMGLFAVIAHPTWSRGTKRECASRTKRRTSSTEARFAFAVLMTERNAA